MAFRKTCLFFVALFALALGVLSGSVHAVPVPIIVSGVECPSNPVASHSCWDVLQTTKVCMRTDSDVEVISFGTWEWVENQDTGRVEWKHCDGCPENTPGSQSFTKTLSVPFTEVVTVTVAKYGITEIAIHDSANVKTKLENSIGHPGARTAPLYVTSVMSSTTLRGCTMQAAGVHLPVRKNIETRMTHEYEWAFTVMHNPYPMTPTWNMKCSICGYYPSKPYPCGNLPGAGNPLFPLPDGAGVDGSKPGTRYSTAVGSSYGSAVVHQFSAVVDCYE